MERHEIEIKGKGIRVYVLSAIFILIGVIVMIASYVAIRKIYNRYDEMADSYQFAEIDREAAESFKTASDYLTNQARQFVATGDVVNANNYFEEVNDNQRRNIALDTMGDATNLSVENELLKNAMQQSEELVKYEVHAMKLTARAMKIDESTLPTEVSSYVLPDNEVSLSSAEQQKLAIQLVFGKEYESIKEKINWEVEHAGILVKEESAAQFRKSEASLIIMLDVATVLVSTMFVLIVLIFIFDTLLVVKPAEKFTKAIDEGKELPIIGGYEFRKFARKYNEVYHSDKMNKDLLKEQGEIDELTGALKVNTIDTVRHTLSHHNGPIGIMMVDIDNFRSIKDANGFEMADKVVKKVANQFLINMKDVDYIVRISKDEFELFVHNVTPADSERIAEILNNINKAMKDTSDGVVEASISVGVAFSEDGYDVEVERKADMALNNVKENARGTCKIV